MNALHVAAGAGNIAGIRFCIGAGIDVNSAASNGATPLLFAAAWCRDGAVFQVLAEAGANNIVRRHIALACLKVGPSVYQLVNLSAPKVICLSVSL